MKKIYLLTVLVAVVSFTFAQKSANGYVKMHNTEIAIGKTPTDTIFPPSITDAGFAPALYGSTGGGYVFGPNGYGDIAKANAFLTSTAYAIEGCLFLVGAKEIVGTPGDLMVKVLNCDGTGTATSGTVSTAPGTELGSVTVSMTNVDTAALNFVTFSAPIQITSGYAICFDFAQLGDDTLGFVSSTVDGVSGIAPGAMELAWDKWSDATWHTLLEPNNWSMDMDMFIGVILDDGSANINDNYFFDGIKLSQNQPNPSSINTLIQYEIENTSNVTLEIYDMTGRCIMSYDEGKQNAGRHNIMIDSEKLANGTYYYSLKADSKRLTKKMIISE